MPRQPGLKWQDPSEERGLRKRALHSAADFTLWGWLILKQYKDEKVVIKKKKKAKFLTISKLRSTKKKEF